jgi:hypothetical protein
LDDVDLVPGLDELMPFARVQDEARWHVDEFQRAVRLDGQRVRKDLVFEAMEEKRRRLGRAHTGER